MKNERLKFSIHNILLLSTEGLSEYALIQQLQDEDDYFASADESDEVILFQKHFLVMNALYQLQVEMLEKSVYLSISPLLIQLTPLTRKTDNTLLTNDTNTELRAYYMNWDNFKKTTQADVRALLDGFWGRYYASEKREDALCTLGLNEDVNWESIKIAYRRLIAKHHPDKGGSHTDFIALKEAYDVLSYCYKR